MNKHELHNNIEARVAIVPQTQTDADTAIVGEIIDMQGYDACEFAIALGTLTDANCTFAVSMEHGDNSALSDTAAVTSADDLLGTLADAGGTYGDDKETRKIGYRGSKRYIRLTVTPSGNNSGDFPVSALALMYPGSRFPVA